VSPVKLFSSLFNFEIAKGQHHLTGQFPKVIPVLPKQDSFLLLHFSSVCSAMYTEKVCTERNKRRKEKNKGKKGEKR
jgi:hypothetical protein